MIRVLIVEDSPTQAEALRIVLDADGFEVEVKLDPLAALDHLDTRMPDIVLSDVVMPSMSGYELCKRIKARFGRRVPVALLTTLDDPREILHALECGADSFIKKARNIREVPLRIRNLLSARAARATSAPAQSEGLEVVFLGSKCTVSSGREQVLDLLLSTFEDYVSTNRALTESMEKLASQNEALVRAERRRKELGSLIVHDLKSPPAGLMMLARARLRKPELSEDEKRSWRVVQETAEASQRMTLDLLDLTRSEDGRVPARPIELDLAELIDRVRQLVESLAADRRQTLAATIDDGARMITADRSLLTRILLNLLENAIRHASEGGTILIDATRTETGTLELRVLNDGDPIPPAFRDKIFERYARLEGAAGESFDTGRGLGLAFCRVAAEAHGGSIGVEDDPRAATSFVLRIPQPR